MSAAPLQSYRRVLREVGLAPRKERSKTIPRALRQAFSSEGGSTVATRDAENIYTFLRAHRLHKALVHRYNPATDLTAEERIRATARRVGLDVTRAYDT